MNEKDCKKNQFVSFRVDDFAFLLKTEKNRKNRKKNMTKTGLNCC